MTRAKDISKIVTDANLSGTLDVAGNLTVDTNTLHVDSTNNRVGIGTTGPATPLDVRTTSPTIRSTYDSSGTYVQMFHNGSNGYFDFSSGSQIWRGAGQAERMRIDSSGNVGIGVTSLTQKLEVAGKGVFSTANPDVNGLKITATTGTNASAMTFSNTATAYVGLDNSVGGRISGVPYGLAVWNGSAYPVVFGTNGSERMRIDSSGNVGIATSTPQKTLDVRGTFAISNSNTSYWNFDRDDSGGQLIISDTNTERMRIDGSGNLLVGHTSQYSPIGDGGSGITLNANGQLFAGGQFPSYFNREDSNGEIVVFRKDGSTVGTIGTPGNNDIYIADSGVGLRMSGSGTIDVFPCNGTGSALDNVADLGASGARFDDIYATNGTIQTSDRNEKQDIEELSDAEQRVAVVAKGLMRKFRWKDKVAEKGDNARTHFGIIAQDLQDAFTAEGLDAGDYAMFTSTTWWEKEISVDAVEADEENGIEAKDAYIYIDRKNEATEGYTEKTRLGVRYNQLLAFIISAI